MLKIAVSKGGAETLYERNYPNPVHCRISALVPPPLGSLVRPVSPQAPIAIFIYSPVKASIMFPPWLRFNDPALSALLDCEIFEVGKYFFSNTLRTLKICWLDALIHVNHWHSQILKRKRRFVPVHGNFIWECTSLYASFEEVIQVS